MRWELKTVKLRLWNAMCLCGVCMATGSVSIAQTIPPPPPPHLLALFLCSRLFPRALVSKPSAFICLQSSQCHFFFPSLPHLGASTNSHPVCLAPRRPHSAHKSSLSHASINQKYTTYLWKTCPYWIVLTTKGRLLQQPILVEWLVMRELKTFLI